MLSIINRPIYFKSVEEAFAFANPGLRKLLLPKENITPQQILTKVSQLADKAKNGNAESRSISLEACRELTDKLINYIKRGAIGEVLFKQALKKDSSKLMEQIKSIGIEI